MIEFITRRDEMFGQTLKQIREAKNLTAKEVAHEILSPSQLSRIEKDEGLPAADKFFKLLSRLNTDFEEFSLVSDDPYLNQRTILQTEVGETLRQKNPKKIRALIEKLELLSQKYGDSYFNHMKSILKASFILHTTNDTLQARSELKTVVEYLKGVNTWYLYELTLFNNTFMFYDYDTSISFSNFARKSLEKRYHEPKYVHVSRSILYNLAVKSLEENLYLTAYNYANEAIGLPQSTISLYTTTQAKIIIQIASYKLKNGQFEPKKLSFFLQYFTLMDMSDISLQFKKVLEKHHIPTTEF